LFEAKFLVTCGAAGFRNTLRYHPPDQVACFLSPVSREAAIRRK